MSVNGRAVIDDPLLGTVTLSTFNEDEVAGTFDASVLVMALGSSDEMREAHGTFVAPRCARIHDY